jgi:hypothetical protein
MLGMVHNGAGQRVEGNKVSQHTWSEVTTLIHLNYSSAKSMLINSKKNQATDLSKRYAPALVPVHRN